MAFFANHNIIFRYVIYFLYLAYLLVYILAINKYLLLLFIYTFSFHMGFLDTPERERHFLKHKYLTFTSNSQYFLFFYHFKNN